MEKGRQSSEAFGSLQLDNNARICATVDDGSTNTAETRLPELFQHESLDHYKSSIRLIRFEDDGETSDQIQGVMRHASTEADYTCLSYRWGTDHPTHRIIINGKAMYIRRNLHDFLTVQKNKASQSQERKLRSTPWLWIDALCIDQDNINERNHQVQQMGEIFTRAEQVYIWLGVVEEVLGCPKAQKEGCLLRAISQNASLRYWTVANQYWCRAWITQEVILAKQSIVLIHDIEMRLEDLGKLIGLMASQTGEQWDQYVRIYELCWKRKLYKHNISHTNDSLIRL